MKWFQNLNTMAKLMISFGVLLACMLLISYEGVSNLTLINSRLAVTYDRDLLGLAEMSEAAKSQLKCARLVRNAAIATGDSAEVDKTVQQLDLEFEQGFRHLAKAESKFTDEVARAKFTKAKLKLSEYQQGCADVIKAVRTGQMSATRAEMKRFGTISDSVDASFADAAKDREASAALTKQRTGEIYVSARKTLIVLASANIVFGLLVGFFIARGISEPLGRAVTTLGSLADGDLTCSLRVDRTDEIGVMATTLNRAIESMSTALVEVRRSSEEVATASQQLADGSSHLSDGAQKTTASLEETSASLEQITSTIRQNSDNAKQANALTNTACDDAVQGGQVVEAAVAAMAEINTSSRKISDIIKRIDEIAFQTNLLAINAAIEAARAGEQGRGFAVVAEEVRALALRSATAAKEIKSLINDSVRKVENGSQSVNQSGETLKGIVSSVKRAADVVSEISAACAEQAAGIEQINIAVAQLNTVNQVSAEQTDRVSSTAQHMSEHAGDLQRLLARFVLPEQSPVAETMAEPKTPSSSAASASPALQALDKHLQQVTAGYGNKAETFVEF